MKFLKGLPNFLKFMKENSSITLAIKKSQKGGMYEGKVFVITGTLSQPRKFFVKFIEDNGGKISSSVSKKVDFLLAGEKAGSKLAKAKKLGIMILSENEL